MPPPLTIPSNTSLLLVGTSSLTKTFILPAISTNPGRLLIFKDIYGSFSTSSVFLSTTGLDGFENNGSTMTLATSYGAWTLMNDAMTKWFLIDSYKNTMLVSLTSVGLGQLVAGYILNLEASTFTSGATSWTPSTGNTWTIYNSPSVATSPTGTNVMVFNGSSTYCMDQTGISSASMYNYTFEIWCYPSGDGSLVSEMGPGGWHVEMMGFVSGTIYCGYWPSPYYFSLGSYTANTWIHICYTYNNSTGADVGYVNGVQTGTGSSSKQWPGTGYYAIGASETTSFGNSSYFNGRVGAFRIYPSILTAAQIKQNYNAQAARYGKATI